MLKWLIKSLLLTIFGKNRYRRTPDVFDVMFDQPHLTLRQADWKVNGRRIVLRWATLFVITMGLIGLCISLWG
jgi:hypothetical protein